jgi:hypothetical protein
VWDQGNRPALHLEGAEFLRHSAHAVVEGARVGGAVEDEADIEDELVAGIAAVEDVHGMADETEAEGCNADQLSAEIAGCYQMI